MALDDICDILACPRCGGSLTLHERMLQCENRHSFDIAKQGYLNLLGAAQPKNADTPAMVEARAAFLHQGHYAPLADVLAATVAGTSTVVDAGCGTGYYLASMLSTAERGLGFDVSVAAVKRAARAHERLGAVVADTWKPLPIKDSCADVVTAVFAPRNLCEFARILAPGGRLVVAAPESDHLVEAREVFGLLDVQPGKHEALLADTAELFELMDSHVVRHELDLDAEAAALLVAMGPNAFHEHAAPAAIVTTCAVRVSSFRLR